MLMKNRSFTIVAALTIGLAIGLNTSIFSIVDAVLLHPLPFPDSGRLALVWETDPNREIVRGIASPAEFLDWRDQNHVFEQMSAWRTWFYNVTGHGEPEQVWGVHTSANFFELLGVRAALGRTFIPEDERPGHEQVVILSHGMWARHYGSDPGLIGQSIAIDEKPYTVIGVLPADFSLFGTVRQYDLWMPFAFERAQLRRADRSILVFARLKPDVTFPQAQAEMSTIFGRLQQAYPGISDGMGIRVVAMHEDLTMGLRPALIILLAAVGFVLLIACANVANLLLARAATREKELALRTVLGAGRLRLARQLVTESVVLAMLGGVLGLLLAFWGLRLILIALPPSGGYGEIPHHNWIGINGPVLGFTLLLSFVTGIIFGLAPALHISRKYLNESLKEGGRGSTVGRQSSLLRNLLVVSEVALSLVLLVGAGLLIQSFVRLLAENTGFNPKNVLTMQVWLPESRYQTGQQVRAFFQQSLERVNAVPGIESAGAINFLPLSGWRDYTDIAIEGRPAPPPGQEFNAQFSVVDSNYFHVMGIPLKQGRVFASADGDQAPGVAIINETMALRYWPQENPLGKRIKPDFPETRSPWRPQAMGGWLTIVGIVGDVREWQFGEKRTAQMYLPYLQNPSRIMRLAIRTSSDPMALVSDVRHAILNVDKDRPVTEIKTMEQFLSEALSQRRLNMLLLGVFASLALVLAAVGIYGVMAYSVAQRTHEIGIRMALGAQPRDVMKLVVGQGMLLSLVGVVLGLALSFVVIFLLTRLLVGFVAGSLFGVTATDPLTFAGVAVLLLAVAFAACYFPARRAMRVDPMVALRYE
jgi:putative ABC transport system permease protein